MGDLSNIRTARNIEIIGIQRTINIENVVSLIHREVSARIIRIMEANIRDNNLNVGILTDPNNPKTFRRWSVFISEEFTNEFQDISDFLISMINYATTNGGYVIHDIDHGGDFQIYLPYSDFTNQRRNRFIPAFAALLISTIIAILISSAQK